MTMEQYHCHFLCVKKKVILLVFIINKINYNTIPKTNIPKLSL